MSIGKISGKPTPKKTQAKKKGVSGGRKKKQVLKFHIECKNPAEDGILKTQNFVILIFIRERGGGVNLLFLIKYFVYFLHFKLYIFIIHSIVIG